MRAWFLLLKEIVGAGGKTVWGNPAEVGKAVEGATFDVVLDNNGKDLDTVRFVALILVARWYLTFKHVGKAFLVVNLQCGPL